MNGLNSPKDSRKFKQEDLAKAVKEQPDLMLKEFAKQFGAHDSVICKPLSKIGITRKKMLQYAQAFTTKVFLNIDITSNASI